MSLNRSITATFRVKNESAEVDQTLALLGSDKYLGRWSLREPVYCQKYGVDMWEATIKLTPGTTVYWSCIVLDIRGRFTKRETCPSRRVLRIEEDSPDLEINATWNGGFEVRPKRKADQHDISYEPSTSRHPTTTPKLNTDESPNRLKTIQATTTFPQDTKNTRTIPVTFVVRCPLERGEDTLAIIGSPESLGEWKLGNATCAQYMANDVWEVKVQQEPGTTLFWSCVTLDRLGQKMRREELPKCRKLHIADTSPNVTIRGEWGQTTMKTATDREPTRPNCGGIWAVIRRSFSTLRGRRKYMYTHSKSKKDLPPLEVVCAQGDDEGWKPSVTRAKWRDESGEPSEIERRLETPPGESRLPTEIERRVEKQPAGVSMLPNEMDRSGEIQKPMGTTMEQAVQENPVNNGWNRFAFAAASVISLLSVSRRFNLL